MFWKLLAVLQMLHEVYSNQEQERLLTTLFKWNTTAFLKL